MRLDLYWIPLGAGERPGQSVVRFSGRLFEAASALVQRRPRCALFHSALVVTTDSGSVSIEMAPVENEHGRIERGVVAEGPVGLRWLGRFRVFRYEVRRWPDGVIPDLVYAVASPVRLSDDAELVRVLLDRLPDVPTPVWGRDELDAGEMWNCNSMISWVLAQVGLVEAAGSPPSGGRAPGWRAGLEVAHRHS